MRKAIHRHAIALKNDLVREQKRTYFKCIFIGVLIFGSVHLALMIIKNPAFENSIYFRSSSSAFTTTTTTTPSSSSPSNRMLGRVKRLEDLKYALEKISSILQRSTKGVVSTTANHLPPQNTIRKQQQQDLTMSFSSSDVISEKGGLSGAAFPPESNILSSSSSPSSISSSVPSTEGETNNGRDEAKLNEIKASFKLAWNGYSKYCWGRDELKPLSKSCNDWVHMGLTIIDALDSLFIMGFRDEFQKAKEWVRTSLQTNINQKISFFESIIRVTGGLLSAYELSGDKIFLDKAVEVQNGLNKAFDKTQSGLPISEINPVTGQGDLPGWTGRNLILAEVASNVLEFSKLTQLTKNPVYSRLAERVINHLDQLPMNLPKGLYPTYLNPTTGAKASNDVSIGGMGDSWYEYELKAWLLLSRKNPKYQRMYLESIRAIQERLVGRTKSGKAWIKTLKGPFDNGMMEHLVCFLPGTIALGVHNKVSENQMELDSQMELAKDLMDTCYDMYDKLSSTKLAPDSVRFRGGAMTIHGSQFRLRPETVESLFYMWRITHDDKYRKMAWNIFKAMDTYCKVDGVGHANIFDVNSPSRKEDRMESFWLAETLKYLYLTFEDDSVIDINKFVFNTEAHPFRVIEKKMDLDLVSSSAAS